MNPTRRPPGKMEVHWYDRSCPVLLQGDGGTPSCVQEPETSQRSCGIKDTNKKSAFLARLGHDLGCVWLPRRTVASDEGTGTRSAEGDHMA